MVDLGSPAPLPEGLALSSIKSNVREDNDDMTLMHGESHFGDILVTNQIVPFSQPTSLGGVEEGSQRMVEEGTAPPIRWGIQPPPQIHGAGQELEVR